MCPSRIDSTGCYLWQRTEIQKGSENHSTQFMCTPNGGRGSIRHLEASKSVALT